MKEDQWNWRQRAMGKMVGETTHRSARGGLADLKDSGVYSRAVKNHSGVFLGKAG